MNQSTRRMAALCLLFALTPCGLADVLRIPLGSQTADTRSSVPLPQHGMSTADVRGGWGEPVREHAAVGSPAIMRWEYPAFDVYFENTTVLHAVLHFRPKAELAPPPASDSDSDSE